MSDLVQDLRLGPRLLARRPGFAAVAVATLALGIGANAALFSVVEAVLLRPLPFHEPERLVIVWERNVKAKPAAQRRQPRQLRPLARAKPGLLRSRRLRRP